LREYGYFSEQESNAERALQGLIANNKPAFVRPVIKQRA
jgi:hypothetical protein